MLDADDTEEVVEDVSPSKGKTIFGSIAKTLKRKTSQRSPEAATTSKKGSRHSLVCVDVPKPPIPLTSYVQLGSRPSAPSSSISISEEPAPPLSSSPSLASFNSTGSDQQFEIQRLQHLLTASQEDLVFQKQHYEEQLRRQEERIAAERALFQSKIDSLQGGVNYRSEEGSGSGIYRGEGSSQGSGW